MQLFRLVYYSTNKLRSRGRALASDLKVLLSQSIRNNSKFGISGGLVFNRTNFLQVLEGDKPDVQQIYERISVDPRHTDVTTVAAELVTKRLFDVWAMGYAGRNATIERLHQRLYYRGGAFSPAQVNTGTLVSLVLEFVSKEEKIASTASDRIFVD